MATTERSLGWATGVASTDGATTYDSSRMSAFERAGLGTGVLLTGSYLAMSGSGTTTLTIADGTAIVGGYFYESNGNVTISTSTLGSGTFSVVIIANTAAGKMPAIAKYCRHSPISLRGRKRLSTRICKMPKPAIQNRSGNSSSLARSHSAGRRGDGFLASCGRM